LLQTLSDTLIKALSFELFPNTLQGLFFLSLFTSNLKNLSYVCIAKLFKGGNFPPEQVVFLRPKIQMAVPFNEPFGKAISPLESFAALNEHRFLCSIIKNAKLS